MNRDYIQGEITIPAGSTVNIVDDTDKDSVWYYVILQFTNAGIQVNEFSAELINEFVFIDNKVDFTNTTASDITLSYFIYKVW